MLLRLCIGFMILFTILCIFLLIIVKNLDLRLIIGFMFLMHIGVCVYFGGNVFKYSSAYGLHEVEVNIRGEYLKLQDTINNHPELGVQEALDNWNELVIQEQNNIQSWSLRSDVKELISRIKPIHIDEESIGMLERGELKLQDKELVYTETNTKAEPEEFSSGSAA